MSYKLIMGCVMFTFVGLNAAQLVISGNLVFIVPLAMCFLSGCIFMACVLDDVREEVREEAAALEWVEDEDDADAGGANQHMTTP